jgi:predicted anti-sigma-YlaC factor YlaD
MECDTYQEQMSLWIDGQLTEDEIQHIESHAAVCASCRTSLDGLRRLDRLFSAAPMTAPMPGFTDRFQARLDTRRRRTRTWAGLLTLALATLVLVLGASAVLAASGLTLWDNLAITGITGLLLDLGKAMAVSLNLTWLILRSLARVLQHPVFIAYFAATAILIAAWTQIITRRVRAQQPV